MARPTPRIPSGKGNFGSSRTQPHKAQGTDINDIMSRHARLPAGSPIGHGQGTDKMSYMDLTILPESYHAAQNLVVDMKHRFSALPSRVRARFANEPVQLLRFLQDPRNLEEARRLGLVAPAAPGSRGDVPPDPKAYQVDLEDQIHDYEDPAPESPPTPKRPKKA